MGNHKRETINNNISFIIKGKQCCDFQHILEFKNLPYYIKYDQNKNGGENYQLLSKGFKNRERSQS